MDERWLKQRLTVAQAEHMVWGGRVPDPFPSDPLAVNWHELLAGKRPGDELWEYDSPQEDWERLMGSYGVALVRGGAVVATQVIRMN